MVAPNAEKPALLIIDMVKDNFDEDLNLPITPKNHLSRKGLRILAFRRLCPVECEAYSSGVSEKLININLSVLCDSAVKIKDTFTAPITNHIPVVGHATLSHFPQSCLTPAKTSCRDFLSACEAVHAG